MHFSAYDHYFGFVPLADHLPTCSRAGTSLWEVSRIQCERLRSEDAGGPYTETVHRYVCTECGVVRMDRAQNWATGLTTTLGIGYGTTPQQCGEVWLHAGPPHEPYHEPEIYYVTGSATRPLTTEDVIGAVGWFRPIDRARFGDARWWAGYGLTSTGNCRTTMPADMVLRTRMAAVKWVTGQHAAAIAQDGPALRKPGSQIPGLPGFVVGSCGHRVAASEWRAGFRTCERCRSGDATGTVTS